MDNEKNAHLSTDQLLKAIVDEASLTYAMRHHMAVCPRCITARDKIERQLDELGIMAEQMAPLPTRSIILPEQKIEPGYWWNLRFRPVLGIATALCLALLVVWGSTKFTASPKVDQVVVNQEVQKTEQLMAEVGMMVENALPQDYQDVLTVFETEPEEDFMEFIVPTEEPDSPTTSIPKKGDEVC